MVKCCFLHVAPFGQVEASSLLEGENRRSSRSRGAAVVSDRRWDVSEERRCARISSWASAEVFADFCDCIVAEVRSATEETPPSAFLHIRPNDRFIGFATVTTDIVCRVVRDAADANPTPI